MSLEYKPIELMVKRAFPDFVSSDYPKMVTFFEKVLEYADQERNPFNVLQHLLEYNISATTLPRFEDAFINQYLPNFPRVLTADLDLIINNVRGFYLSKGTEDSYKFLFQALYGSSLNLEYPRLKVLKASYGLWYTPEYLVLEDAYGDVPAKISTGTAVDYTDLVLNANSPPGSPATITSAAGTDFTTFLSAGGYVLVTGTSSVNDDLIYEIDTVTANTITLANTETLTDDSAGAGTLISMVVFNPNQIINFPIVGTESGARAFITGTKLASNTEKEYMGQTDMAFVIITGKDGEFQEGEQIIIGEPLLENGSFAFGLNYWSLYDDTDTNIDASTGQLVITQDELLLEKYVYQEIDVEENVYYWVAYNLDSAQGAQTRVTLGYSPGSNELYDSGNVASGTDDTSTDAAFMTDSTAAFTVDGLIGSYIYNTADNSYGLITDNTATTVTATLAGGTKNNWNDGDGYTILEWGHHLALANYQTGYGQTKVYLSIYNEMQANGFTCTYDGVSLIKENSISSSIPILYIADHKVDFSGSPGIDFNNGTPATIERTASGVDFTTLFNPGDRITVYGSTSDDTTPANPYYLISDPIWHDYTDLQFHQGSAPINDYITRVNSGDPFDTVFSAGETITISDDSINSGSYAIAADVSVAYSTTGVTFTAPNTITRTDDDAFTDHFQKGDYITVSGSASNNGTFLVGDINNYDSDIIFASQTLASGLTEVDFDFEISIGSAYTVSDSLTLSDGSTVTVDAVKTDGSVYEFTINNATSRGATAGITLTATGGTGSGFELTLTSDHVEALTPDKHIITRTTDGTAFNTAFSNGDTIQISGSLYNNGTYLIDTVSATEIKLDAAEVLTYEDARAIIITLEGPAVTSTTLKVMDVSTTDYPLVNESPDTAHVISKPSITQGKIILNTTGSLTDEGANNVKASIGEEIVSATKIKLASGETLSGDTNEQTVYLGQPGIMFDASDWVDTRGFISEAENRIHDNDRYQDFSYVIYSAVSRESYESIVKDLVHPAGFKLFAEVTFSDNETADYIMPFTIDTSATSEYWTSLGIITESTGSNGFNINISDSTLIEYQAQYGVGNTWAEVEQNREATGVTISDWASFEIGDFSTYATQRFLYIDSVDIEITTT